jgi:hypothetical protein
VLPDEEHMLTSDEDPDEDGETKDTKLYVPAGQTVHDVTPVVVEIDPLAQDVHWPLAFKPSAEKVPTSQKSLH